jgi:hypothetical protein
MSIEKIKSKLKDNKHRIKGTVGGALAGYAAYKGITNASEIADWVSSAANRAGDTVGGPTTQKATSEAIEKLKDAGRAVYNNKGAIAATAYGAYRYGKKAKKKDIDSPHRLARGINKIREVYTGRDKDNK